jgi:hypothetical protein
LGSGWGTLLTPVRSFRFECEIDAWRFVVEQIPRGGWEPFRNILMRMLAHHTIQSLAGLPEPWNRTIESDERTAAGKNCVRPRNTDYNTPQDATVFSDGLDSEDRHSQVGVVLPSPNQEQLTLVGEVVAENSPTATSVLRQAANVGVSSGTRKKASSAILH